MADATDRGELTLDGSALAQWEFVLAKATGRRLGAAVWFPAWGLRLWMAWQP
jgi:hypothetical protein